MPRVPRNHIINPNEESVYHCTSRCVRRAFLISESNQSDIQHSNRKDWIYSKMLRLAECFTIDLLGYSIMSNHMHHALRTRPDILAQLSNEEIIERWWNLQPRFDKNGIQRELTSDIIAQYAQNNAFVTRWRKRLNCPSWYMRELKQYIAKRANREDGVNGHFWQGRFTCRKVIGESAIRTVCAYIDANPIVAKIASSLDRAEHTSIAERIQADDLNEPPPLLTDLLTKKTVKSIKPSSLFRPAMQLSIDEYKKLVAAYAK